MLKRLLVFAPLVAAAQAAPLSFLPPVHLHTGPSPQTVLLADVNHDGKPDILVADNGGGTLSVYLGDGKGGFVASKSSPFPAGESPNDLALGDFNGDGHIDVAIANHSVKLVTVLLGDGRGSFAFAPGSPFAVPSNPHPHGIAVADFNGDGKLDLAVDSWGEDKILVMLGRGDGTFETPGRKFQTGAAPYERLRTADLNEDGHPDLITSNSGGSSLSILQGDGHGQFTLAGGTNLAVSPSPFGVAIGDFNGDHHADIAVVHYSGHATDRSRNRLSVLLGDGTGKFQPVAGSPFRIGHYPPTVVAGDVNGDGLDDIVIPNHLENSVTIYLGAKSGVQEASCSPLPVGRGPQCAAIRDLNGDGKPDLVVTDGDDDEVLIFYAK